MVKIAHNFWTTRPISKQKTVAGQNTQTQITQRPKIPKIERAILIK